MNLPDILRYDNIVIQSHDVPDADSIASGFALLRYIESKGGRARFIYGGTAPITKPNLMRMIKSLDIPITHVKALSPPDLLITVDCQHGAGNVTHFPADAVAVFDHHWPEIVETEYVVIRPALGSCATLIWDMMREAGFDFSAEHKVYDALYYGLFSDTNHFAEMRHPLDHDLAEFMQVDWAVMKQLKHSELSVEELAVVSRSLASPQVIGEMGLFRTEPCDPNILGFSSDIARQVDQFSYCIVYCHLLAGLKLSIRSTVREVMANEMAAFLTKEAGSGGGGIEKAGAYLSYVGIKKVAPGMSPDAYLEKQIRKYQDNYDLIDCGHHNLDFSAARRYVKLKQPTGFARSAELFPENTHICVRTLEGDIDMVAANDIYIMIGIENEVYPIEREKFEREYEVTEEAYVPAAPYPPSVIEVMKGRRVSLLPFVHTCVPRKEKAIRAMPLFRDVKVLTRWDKEKYFLGRIGDYLAVPEQDHNDIYVISQKIFPRTYVPQPGT
ncbi:MAG: DHH family phosphoesterase [Zoogloeaceae bacterium]|nr:DHH family phosphoesterase [Zoogloeaceae bacterium]